MFKSKLRPVVISQAEHAKLAGTLALLWGNPSFDLPEIDRLSFITGVGLHDRGYGPIDAAAIGEISEADWLATTRRGFYMPCSDPVADLIIKHHLKRLNSSGDSAESKALADEMARVVKNRLEQYALSGTQFERIDRITNLCDMIAFDFCFEQAAEGEIMVCPCNDSEDQIAVHYVIEDGKIMADPWPFSVETYSNYLTGYQLREYPAELDPLIIPYHLAKTPMVP
jgi:hypothetical protein